MSERWQLRKAIPGVSLFLLVALVGAISFPWFATPANRLIEHTAHAHKRVGLVGNPYGRCVIAITWFSDDRPTIAFDTFVFDGGVVDHSIRDRGGSRGGGGKVLDRSDLATITKLTADLPPGSYVNGPPSRKLVITCLTGKGRQTYTYDRNRLPQGLKDVEALIQARELQRGSHDAWF